MLGEYKATKAYLYRRRLHERVKRMLRHCHFLSQGRLCAGFQTRVLYFYATDSHLLSVFQLVWRVSAR